MKQLTRKNVAALLVRLQDECDLRANQIATQAMKDFGLRKEHQKITGNPDSAYQPARVPKKLSAEAQDYLLRH